MLSGMMRVLVSLFAFNGALAAQDLTTRPGAEAGPTEVRMRLMIINLDSVDGAAQNFTANVAFISRWQDDRLAHEGPGDVIKSFDDVWHPRLQVLNRQGVRSSLPEEVRVSPSGEVVYMQRLWGQFSQPLELEDFPFDQQRMRIEVVAPGVHTGEVVLVQDPERESLVSKELSVSDWSVVGSAAVEGEISIAGNEGPVPSFTFSVDLRRNSGYYIVNVIFPLTMIILMSWVVFWIKPSNINPRVSVSVTAMLTLVAYRFAVGTNLPKISYLTRMDWFIVGSSVLVFLALLQVVVTSRLEDNGKSELARRINGWMRNGAPVALVAIIVFSFAL